MRLSSALVLSILTIIATLPTYAMTSDRLQAINDDMIFNAVQAYNISYDNATGLVGIPTGLGVEFDSDAQATYYDDGRTTFSSVHTRSMKNFTMISFSNASFTHNKQFHFFGIGDMLDEGDIYIGVDNRVGACPEGNCTQIQSRSNNSIANVIRLKSEGFACNSSYSMISGIINKTNTSSYSMSLYHNSNRLNHSIYNSEYNMNSKTIHIMERGDGLIPTTGHIKVAMIINDTLSAYDLSWIMTRFQEGDYNLTGERPYASNVSITPIPLNKNNIAYGHFRYMDVENSTAVSNSTRWYVNRSILLTGNDTTILGSGNVTELANITFSVMFEDDFGPGLWYNSTTIVVSDTTPPVIQGNSSVASVNQNSIIKLYLNVSESLGEVSSVIAEVENPNTNKDNITASLYQGDFKNGKWVVSYTTSVVGTHYVVWYVKDTNGNEDMTRGYITFTVVSQSTSPTVGGGGSGNYIGCGIELVRPFEGKNIALFGVEGKYTNAASFTIKNNGGNTGTYEFSVKENSYLSKYCILNTTITQIDAGLDFSNNIKCMVSDDLEEGIVSIKGCGTEKNYFLQVGNSKLLAFFSSLISDNEINIYGTVFPSVAFYGIFIVLIFIVLPILVILIGKLTSWGFGN